MLIYSLGWVPLDNTQRLILLVHLFNVIVDGLTGTPASAFLLDNFLFACFLGLRSG